MALQTDLDGILHDGLGDGLLGHASLRYERGKRCNDDMARVDLKKAAKRRTRVAAAKPIGAERGEWGLDIGCYQLRIGAHIICCGNDGTCPRKTAGDVARLLRRDGVQPVSSLDLTRVARKLGEAGRAPHFGSDPPVRVEPSGRLQHLREYCTAGLMLR